MMAASTYSSTASLSLSGGLPTIDLPPVSAKGTTVKQLEGWKYVAYKVALLAPKLLLSGAGWVIGFTLGAGLGAGIGDAIGVFLGCAVSLCLEVLIRKYIMNDPDLDKENALMDLLKERCISAAILSTGSFCGGGVFAFSLETFDLLIDNDFLAALATGAVVSSFFTLGMTFGRAMYSFAALEYKNLKPDSTFFDEHPDLKLSFKNLKADLKLSTFIIFPAQAAFVATALPVFGTTWLLGSEFAILKGAASVAIGGTIGAIAEAGYDHFYKRAFEKVPTTAGIVS